MGKLAVVLGGGGARAAYQIGFLKCIARHFPDIEIPIFTGTSAGAINAAFLANYQGPLKEGIEELIEIWLNLTPADIFKTDSWSLLKNIFSWGYQLSVGGFAKQSRVHSLVDTKPLRTLLENTLHTSGELKGVANNIKSGRIEGVALATTNYNLGTCDVWMQGKNVKRWERLNTVGRNIHLTIDHIMASAALPFFFPAIKINKQWHGDGAICLRYPFTSAIEMGADKIIAISTKFLPKRTLKMPSKASSYPPPAQIAGLLMDVVMHNNFDGAEERLAKINLLLDKIPPQKSGGAKKVKLITLRPSEDISHKARDREPKLPALIRLLLKVQGAHKAVLPDWMSLIMFEPGYLRYLIDLGYNDVLAQKKHLEALIR